MGFSCCLMSPLLDGKRGLFAKAIAEGTSLLARTLLSLSLLFAIGFCFLDFFEQAHQREEAAPRFLDQVTQTVKLDRGTIWRNRPPWKSSKPPSTFIAE